MVKFRLFNTPYVSYRADAILISGPLIGGLIGVLVGYARFWFVDFWLGAAVVLPISLFFAVLWETRARPQTQISWRRILSTGLIAILLAAVAILIVIPMTRTARKQIATLSKLSTGSISHISIYEPFTSNEIRRIKDAQVLDEFVSSARDVRLAWHGSGEVLEEWWFKVHLRDGREIELVWSHRLDAPNTVYGSIVETTPKSLTNRGDFVSDGLRVWFNAQLAGKL